MRDRGPWPSLALGAAVVFLALGVGRVNGVGPLAATPPPETVTDPREMVARSFQAVLDVDAVHLEGTLTGSIPGTLVDRPESSISLAGSTLAIDIRPHDAKTRVHVGVPALALSLDTVTVWNDAWYRYSDAAAWSKTTAGDASAKAGVDINPLTFVDRLREFLAGPGIEVTEAEVTCASASGRCHHLLIVAGRDPARILAAALPDGRGARLPDVPVLVTLDTDALTLRPAHLEIIGASGAGTVTFDLVLDASRWNGDVTIDQPPGG
jgi:hypothetical protein